MKAKMMLAAAMLAAPALMQPAAAQPAPTIWIMANVPNNLAWCRLSVQAVVQDNPNQPLRFTILNENERRVRYTIDIFAPGNSGTQNGSVRVENANARERIVATSTPFAGNLAGRTIRLALASCERRR